MSDVTFLDLRLNPMADPAAGMKFSLQSVDYTQLIGKTVRPYAGGTYKGFRTPGVQMQARCALNLLRPDQVAFLRRWHGQTMCFREGQTSMKFFGSYTDPGWSPLPGPAGSPTSLTFLEETWAGPF